MQVPVFSLPDDTSLIGHPDWLNDTATLVHLARESIFLFVFWFVKVLTVRFKIKISFSRLDFLLLYFIHGLIRLTLLHIG